MNFKNKDKVLNKLKKPSKKKLSRYEKLGFISVGALLTYAGTVVLQRKGWPLALPLFLGGGICSVAGFAAKNPIRPINKKTKKPLKVKTSVTIDKSREEVYDFWRQLENLPLFMEHLKEVKAISDTESHWVANLHQVDMAWNAAITEDKRGKVIAWRSLPGSEVRTEGRVVFKKALNGHGTMVAITLKYGDDTGKLAKAFAKLHRPVFSQQVKEELRKCKKLLEAGNMAKTESEPSSTSS